MRQAGFADYVSRCVARLNLVLHSVFNEETPAMKIHLALLIACTFCCTCSAQQTNSVQSLQPIMNVADQRVYESSFPEAASPRSTSVSKTVWQKRQGTQWELEGGVLQGEESTAEYQAKRSHHHGYDPRIKSLKTPEQFIAKFSVRFIGGEETSLLPLIEFGHHNVRLKFSKTGIVLLADHEQVQLAKTDQVKLEPGRWYHLLAERQADEFVVQFADGPVLYAKHQSLAIPVADDSDGLGIAGTRHGTVQIDNVTLWSIKPDTNAAGWSTTVKTLRSNMSTAVVIQKPTKATKNDNVKVNGSTSKNTNWIKTFLKKNPSADSNEDGILTKQELNRFKQQRKK